MRWSLAILSNIVLIYLSCNNVLSQQEDYKKTIANGVSDLAGKLNQIFYKLAKQNGNVLFSPFNIYVAMGLVDLGADGNTRDEISNFLGFPKDSNGLQRAYEVLSQTVRTIENTTKIPRYDYTQNKWIDAPSAIINIANGIFVQEGVKLNPKYVSQVQSYFRGQVSSVDFAKESDKATDIVNQFVSKSTNGRIPQLFPTPLPTDISVLLAASLYFKASWRNAFSEHNTKEENFNTGSGNEFVKTMVRADFTPYTNLADMQLEAISLPYAGGDTSIFFVLPYSNQTLDNVVSLLNGANLRRIAKESRSAYVHYQIPKTKFKWSSDIENFLVQFGIKDLFSNNANLNNLVSNIPLRVSQVTHAAEIELNEKGTEASAVTVIQTVPYSAVQTPEPIHFHVNRPFSFFIYHHETETILFAGAVHHPNGISNSLPSQ